MRIAEGGVSHALAADDRTACGQALPARASVQVDNFGRIGCGNCNRRLGAARCMPLELDHLIFVIEEPLRRIERETLDELLSADEAPAPAEVRAALAAAQYEAIVRTLCSLCVWPSDRSLARALLGRGLWPHHTRELVELIGIALAEPDAERAVGELRREAAALVAGDDATV